MRDDVGRALAAIEEAQAWLSRQGPIVLTEEYLEAIRRAEALAANQPGGDKSWVERSLGEFLKSYTVIERAR